jgi:predicted porin
MQRKTPIFRLCHSRMHVCLVQYMQLPENGGWFRQKAGAPIQTLENLEMKKTLVALAALAATTAFAQSTVSLTGRASMDVSTWGVTGSTAAGNDFGKRLRVADTASRITFSANEDLGGGTRAGVYCETGINIDNATANGQANSANANTSEWCSREGRMYYGSGNYEVRLGRQNVWWTQGALNAVGSTYLGSDSATNLINGGAGVYGVRLENMAKFAVTGGQFAGSEVYYGLMGAGTGEAAAATVEPKGSYNGFKLQYTAGQWVGLVDYQGSENSLAATARDAVAGSGYAGAVGSSSFDRRAIKYGVSFKYAPTSQVSLQMWDKKRKDKTNGALGFAQNVAINTNNTGDAEDSGYAVVANHDLGGGLMLHAQYAKANNIKHKGTEQANTGATGMTLGATKALSKRTHVYGAYHKITNQSAAIYGMGGGNYQSGIAAAGGDTKMMALGMIHNF